MRRVNRIPVLSGPAAMPIAIAVLSMTIFIVDAVTEPEIAIAVFYIVVVLISAFFSQRRRVLMVSAGCMALTLLAYILWPDVPARTGMINMTISLAAIAATGYLALRIKVAETEAHQARTELVHLARATTLGALTASIAHEINQPLAGMTINGNACLRWLGATPPNLREAKLAVERIIGDAKRASEVVERVRRLVRREPSERVSLDLNRLALETLALMQAEIKANGILLRTELAEDLPHVSGDPVQLQQVILNLTINAIEAMGLVAANRRELIVRTAHAATSVALAVQDSGNGLDGLGADRMFEPFQTSKQNGLGMGLTISRWIIEAHGGRIEGTPAPDRGAIFTLTLPTVYAEPMATAPVLASQTSGKIAIGGRAAAKVGDA
jgi:C4-dicarboxylate-specific signal transduction histidine kinase